VNRVSDWQTIDVSVDGLVAWLRFNRPDRHNAVSSDMVIEVCAALRDLSTDPEVTVVVLTPRRHLLPWG
jgi:2-(1,2-epoxy-1,2-dihydrophenyl)acetyl-CoA isomerase